jgi:microcystin-dependent protein
MKHLSLKAYAATILALCALLYTFVPPPHSARAQFVDQTTWGGTSGGTANAQTITIANYTAHTAGVALRFVPGNTNTGPTNINISALGNVAVQRPSSIGNVALSGGELQSGELTCVIYTGSVYQLCYNVDMTPIGKTVEFRGASAPRGTLIEDGSAVSRTTYAALFTVIGSTYGNGDGSTTFNVPDSRGASTLALDNQGANGAANRVTTAGSGCNATALASTICGAQNQTVTRDKLTNVSVAPTVTDPGHFHSSNPTVFSAGGGNGIAANNTSSVGAFGFNTDTKTTGISVAFNLNGNVTQTPLTTLQPISLVRRAIKY